MYKFAGRQSQASRRMCNITFASASHVSVEDSPVQHFTYRTIIHHYSPRADLGDDMWTCRGRMAYTHAPFEK